MEDKIKAVLPWGIFALAILTISFCGAAFAAAEAQPCVQVGAVAQRYPWNGTVDVSYRASGLPAAGTNAVVTVTANGKAYAQDVTLANGTNTVAFTELPKEINAKDAKVTVKIK